MLPRLSARVSTVDCLCPCPVANYFELLCPTNSLLASHYHFRTRRDFKSKNPLSGFAPKQTKESSAWRATHIVLQRVHKKLMVQESSLKLTVTWIKNYLMSDLDERITELHATYGNFIGKLVYWMERHFWVNSRPIFNWFFLPLVSFCVPWKSVCGRGTLIWLAGVSGGGWRCPWRYSPKSTVVSWKQEALELGCDFTPQLKWNWVTSIKST